MFKKSLAAVAVLGAFAANAMAADVTLYGKIDMGVQYKNAETTAIDGVETKTDAFTLDSGVGQASRLGIKGTEDLGNGLQVGFVLESGLGIDDGSYKGAEDDRLFDREASLKISSDYGTLMAGRFGAFSTAASATDVLLSRVEAFDGGHTGAELVMIPRIDNAIAYLSPKFAGFQAGAIYSLKMDNKDTEDAGREGHSDSNRYMGFAATYDIGALQTAIGYEQILRGETDDNADAKVVTFGANYDFDMFKLYAAAQWFDGMRDMHGSDKVGSVNPDYDVFKLDSDGIEGYSLHLGTQFDALAGHFDAGVYYSDMKSDTVFSHVAHTDGDKMEGNYFGIAGRYIYNLSKRTSVRTTLAYAQETWDKHYTGHSGTAEKWNHDWENKVYTAKVSLTHNF